MRNTQDGGLSPGDIGDPVADGIRAEQARDAAPQAGEVKNNKALECEKCGNVSEDVERRELIIPACSRLQTPDQPWTTLCSDCGEKRDSLREKQRAKARKRLETDYQDDPIAIAFYGCGRAEFITEPDSDEAVPPQAREEPKAPIRCSCGESLDDIELLP